MNTLFVTSPDAYLAKDGENIVVQVDGKEKLRLPIHTLEGIVSFGYAGASPALMHLCAKMGVGLSFHNEYGKFLARVNGPIQGNVLLRKKQYQNSSNEIALKIACNCIAAKILNCKNVLQRAVRDHEQTVSVSILNEASAKLMAAKQSILKADNLETIRGIEGDAARCYFSVFSELILVEKDKFFMNQRSKRPPKDPVNALLSFVYTMLAHDVKSALESVGLDPYVGFLHRDRPGRASLALDIMEELRPFLGDRLVLSLINRKQVSYKDFIIKENGGVVLKDEARNTVLATLHKRKQEEILHPFLNQKIKIGLIPFVQSMLLARYLRNDIDGYPPFFWK